MTPYFECVLLIFKKFELNCTHDTSYSLLLIDVFGKVAKVNAKALNIKSYKPQQKHC